MPSFFIKLLKKIGFKEKERFNCNSCYQLILAVDAPKKCPHCKGPGNMIVKIPPRTVHH
jgi:rubrerythrin